MNKFDLKISEENPNQILWWNGEKWLVKETCVDTKSKTNRLKKKGPVQRYKQGPTKENIKLAEKRLKELQEWQKNQNP